MIKIGTSLQLQRYNEDKLENFKCKIVEKEGSILYIDYPINEETGRTNIFPKGTEFFANFIGDQNSVYRFRTVIMGKKQANIPMLILHYPEDNIQRIQRREYVRINTTLDTAIHDIEDKIVPFTTVTQDISGGGMSLVIPDKKLKLTGGQLLNIWVVLPMESGALYYIETKSKVIRVVQRENMKNLLSVKFEMIKDKDREAVIRYCFENQLRERRRGLS
ncbi:flagellar brake protein [Aquibacillus kalidii]|uniref:flagellar brake protein n=1 Tax=Aquibacillus kalidii TaxID=2762597 RepID=UPI001648009F|nr:flagellar brake domain-containing protein [Aquibacillus kalidii]